MHIWVWEYVWCGGSLISHGLLDNNCQGRAGAVVAREKLDF